ncbi:MAG: hypothetical protein F6K36_00050 [Symploca sp. SIO3C6]|nr:hypothetical protein [Symploca sp. SIO3C6]
MTIGHCIDIRFSLRSQIKEYKLRSQVQFYPDFLDACYTLIPASLRLRVSASPASIANINEIGIS